jgi:hypothetical protein
MEYRKEKKGTLKRLGHFIKEYNGPLPIFSGVVVSGAITTAAFTIAAIYNAGQNTASILTSGNVDLVGQLYNLPEMIGKIYADSRVFAASWTMPGFAVGQFAGYKLKKSIGKLLKKL